MTKEKILRVVMYTAGLLALAVFVITKNEYLMDRVTAAMYDDGDLYRFTKVRDFKVDLPPRLCIEGDTGEDTLDPGDQTIFMIGDSFLETCRGHAPLPLQLSQKLGKRVYTVYAGNTQEYFNPVYLFMEQHIDSAAPRLVILERVERYIIDEFSEPRDYDELQREAELHTQTHPYLSNLRERWFTHAERNYEIFLTGSFFTSGLIESWNTLCFHLLGQISSETPAYSLNPPFLFYREDIAPELTTSFYYPHTDSLVAQIADNLKEISDQLQSRYNTELVFMPIPNAYTLYHRFINNDRYDDFLPRLYAALGARGVPTVRLYQKFVDSPEILYFPTDSHWNAGGVAMTVEELLPVVRNHIHE